ncbi:MAG: replication-relaxation family protein [Bacteroidetes bacterium]|nr:replication-relaxation family protein [Bacteroidota bacterium]
MRKESYYSSPVQDEVMSYLYLVRGADIEQITRALNSIKLNHGAVNEKRVKKTYDILRKLKKYGLIDYQTYKLSERSRGRRIIFLSKAGLMELNNKRNIQEKTRGSGFFGDFGYFKHSLYSPPMKSLRHHLMTVDVMTDAYILSKLNKVRMSVANNLYVAEKVIKPDFGVLIKGEKHDQTYYIEIDRSTERGQALLNKFKKYNTYFQQLKRENKPLPSTIFFVVPNGQSGKGIYAHEKQVRFRSVAKAFCDTCGSFTEEVDLCYVEMNTFLTTFISEVKNISRGNLVKLEGELVNTKFGKIRNSIISFNQSGKKAEVLYLSVEGCRIKPWILMFKTLKELKEHKSMNHEILTFFDSPKITLIYSEERPVEPFSKEFLAEKGVNTPTERKI